MSKKFLYPASILLTIILGAVLYWYYCCECSGRCGDKEAATQLSDEEVTEAPASVPESPPAIDWQAVRDQVNTNPPTLRFEAYQTESSFNNDGSVGLEKIMDYLENNPDGELLVTGHADISGPRSLNMELSQKRALFLESVLVQQGIQKEKITSTFKGPDDPIADNGTAEGRAKNRRAVVIIK